MPKFQYSQIGNEGVAYLIALAARKGPRYLHAAEQLVDYGASSFAAVHQDLAANHVGLLYNTDPDDMLVGPELKAAAEAYAVAKEAADEARKAKRRKGRA